MTSPAHPGAVFGLAEDLAEYLRPMRQPDVLCMVAWDEPFATPSPRVLERGCVWILVAGCAC